MLLRVCVCFRDTSDLSAVCVYRVSDISRVFAEGKYKTPVTVETSFVKWVMYSGDVPDPRPGAVSPNTVLACVCMNHRIKMKTEEGQFFSNTAFGSQLVLLFCSLTVCHSSILSTPPVY